MASWALIALAALAAAQASDKRGLCFTPNPEFPSDNHIWDAPGSRLSWYYNYGPSPSPAYVDRPQDEFEFIPMMWGVGPNPDDTNFLDTVRGLIDSGTEIRHVLGFNEPNGQFDTGGSEIAPAVAARAWVANFEPLGRMGVKLGLPACTGAPDGLVWLKDFLGNCSEIVSTGSETRNCTWDFLPVHWYDNFEGLASHIGERLATWPGSEIWVTEYAYAHRDLAETQAFFHQTLDWFDREDFIGKYTYFGAFRSATANVGVNAAFLNNDGELTDIGAEYVGEEPRGILPDTGKASGHTVSVVVMGMSLVASVILVSV
ncbi:hypothetical protein B0I35DRAFT_476104 [Stachybotrys elegans]|uniref:Asl1-like glycosyl hydrolase catalytic domain-containing protein n=1 Tax=Stachybotrys elegans TaxID=80388 RepID=A0A8K0WU75_9HYPO|nr:hypothetical protein B0I35DRAFT_476104 [Stachybotrys elegans]